AQGQRPAVGALHLLVDVAVADAVDGVGPAGGQRPAEEHGQHQPGRRHAPVGQHHGRHRRHQQQLDDAGLGQPDVGPHPAAPTGLRHGRSRVEGAGVGCAHWALPTASGDGLRTSTSAPSPAGRRQASRAAVNSAPQIRAPVARWAVRVTADSLVHTLPAPSRISTPMRATATRTMAVTGGAWGRRRTIRARAKMATATTAATIRWAKCRSGATPWYAGITRPSNSGQVRKARPPPRPAMYDPSSMRNRAEPATVEATAAKRRSAPAPGWAGDREDPAGWASTTSEMSTATRLMATRRWATTDSAFRSRWTTMAPRMAWDRTIGSGMTARVNTRLDSWRRLRNATTARATVSQMTMEAVARWEYAMMAWYSSGG